MNLSVKNKGIENPFDLDFQVYTSQEIAEEKSWIICVQSGKTSMITDQTKDNLMFDYIDEQLGEEVIVVRLDFPEKDNDQVSLENDVENRAERLAIVIDAVLTKNPSDISLIGVSLGSITILKILMQSWAVHYKFKHCYFVSLVLEYPVNIYASIDSITLFYGGDDYIAYVESEGKNVQNVVQPDVYGELTNSFLNSRPNTDKKLLIFEKHNHYLWHSDQKFNAFLNELKNLNFENK